MHTTHKSGGAHIPTHRLPNTLRQNPYPLQRPHGGGLGVARAQCTRCASVWVIAQRSAPRQTLAVRPQGAARTPRQQQGNRHPIMFAWFEVARAIPCGGGHIHNWRRTTAMYGSAVDQQPARSRRQKAPDGGAGGLAETAVLSLPTSAMWSLSRVNPRHSGRPEWLWGQGSGVVPQCSPTIHNESDLRLAASKALVLLNLRRRTFYNGDSWARSS